MKTFIFLLTLLLGVGTMVQAQDIPAWQYSRLVPNANDANNPIVREYKQTGKVAAGYSVVRVSELLSRMNAVALWAEMDPASHHNQQVHGGIYMAPYEKAILDPQGHIHSMVTCANMVVRYKFIYRNDLVVQKDCYECCETNVTVRVNGKVAVKSTSSDGGKSSRGKNYSVSVSYN